MSLEDDGPGGARATNADQPAAAEGTDFPDRLRRQLQTPLDALLVDATRLRLMAALNGLPASGRMSFTAIRGLLRLTDGNLGMHLRALAEVGYLDVVKTGRGSRSQSLYAATTLGRAALAAHVAALEAIIAAANPSG